MVIGWKTPGGLALQAEWEKHDNDHRRLAYILATAWHETAQRMEPIREFGLGRGKAYGIVDSTGKAPYGRGFVQLTWRANYVKADERLGLKGALAKNYDLALEPPTAAAIAVQGMLGGWFTGKKLGDFIAGPRCEYVSARQIINGMDRAALIADYAQTIEKTLGS